MPKYVSLLGWTEQGIQSYKETLARADAAKKMAAELGGTFDLHWTLGEYDLVAVSEFPDDETATAFLLKLGSFGNVRSKTMRAFDESEIEAIIAKT